MQIPTPYELVGDPAAGGALVFSCEHATNLLPEWKPEPADLPLLEDHWGWDVGAADLTRELCRVTDGAGVLSRFSRLVCDPNRSPRQESFVVREIDGQALSFNREVDDRERQRRRRTYFEPFHEALHAALEARAALGTPFVLCAIHSFTPVFLGRARAMEIGILFDAYDARAFRLESALLEQGFEAVLNAPYSARDGFIHSANRHGNLHGIPYVELEVRQDLIDTSEKAAATAERIAPALPAYTD
jgi:predicted N-formylglutamate amidohydrolase